MVILYLIVFAILVYIIARSGDIWAKTAINFSFLILTFAAIVPALFIGIISAVKNLPIISLGNVLGSNLVNLSFALGIVAVLNKGIKINNRIVKRDAWIAFFFSALPVLLIADGKLSRGEGFLLLIIFGGYLYFLFKQRQALKQRVERIRQGIVGLETLGKKLLYFILATAVLIVSAWGLTEATGALAKNLYVPIVLISIIVVALGISLTDLFFGAKTTVIKHEGMVLENLITGIVANSTLVLGITALINPIKIDQLKIVFIAAGFMLLAMLLANIFLSTRNKLSVKEGWILIGFYIVFLIVEFLFR